MVETEQDSKGKYRSRRFRWIFWISLFCCIWLFLGWGLPAIVDKRHLRNSVIDWAQHMFSMTTPVSMGSTDLALRTNLRTDLYIHDLEFDPPNPSFDLPWLQVDTIRASDQIYRLFGGVDATPVIQLRDMILRVETDNNGECNVSGLGYSPESEKLPLMRHLKFGAVTFELMNDAFVFSSPDCHIRMSLNGQLIFSGGCAKIHGMRIPVQISLREDGVRHTMQASARLKNLCYTPQSDDISAEIEIKQLPLDIFKQIIADLPLPAGELFSDLNLRVSKGNLQFSGEIYGIEARNLPSRCIVSGRAVLKGRQLQEVVIETSNSGGQGLAAFGCKRNPQGEWGQLEILLHSLELSQFRDNESRKIVAHLCRIFPAIKLTVGRLTLQGLNLGETAADIIPQKDGKINLSAEGKVGGGSFSVVAKGQPLGEWMPPQSFICSLKVPDAGDMLRRFSAILPHVLQFSVTSGKGELTLNYEAGQLIDEGRPDFLLNLQLDNVTIPTLTGGLLVQELAGIERRMVELENLCRRTAVTPRDSLVYNPESFSSIRLDSLKLSYALSPWENGRLRGLIASSPQLGYVEGVGREEDGDVFRMSIFISKLPGSFYKKLDKLSPDVRQALAAYLKQSKLKIEINCAGKESTVNPVYVQDVFRFWGQQQARKDHK